MHGLHHKWDLQKMGWDSYGIPWRGAFLLDSFLKIWNHQPSSTPTATWPMIRTIIWQSILTGKWKDVESVFGLSGYFTLAWYLARTTHGITGACVMKQRTLSGLTATLSLAPLHSLAIPLFPPAAMVKMTEINPKVTVVKLISAIGSPEKRKDVQDIVKMFKKLGSVEFVGTKWFLVFLPQSITSCGRCLNSRPTIEQASSRKYTKDIHVYGDDIIGAGKLFYASKSQKPYTLLDRCSGKEFCGWQCFDIFSVCQRALSPFPQGFA